MKTRLLKKFKKVYKNNMQKINSIKIKTKIKKINNKI